MKSYNQQLTVDEKNKFHKINDWLVDRDLHLVANGFKHKVITKRLYVTRKKFRLSLSENNKGINRENRKILLKFDEKYLPRKNV